MDLNFFKDKELLKLSLTHSSCTKDNPEIKNNERLEFYGDAVLKLVMSKYLFERFTDQDEGLLTKYRAHLISDDLLSELGESLKLEDKILVGSTMNHQKLPASIIGNAVEALIGAIYIDQGYDKAESFILELWQDEFDSVEEKALEKEYKSRLQELTQKKFKEAPFYKTLDAFGPDHNKKFEVGVFLEDKLIAVGDGPSKKSASQKAAQKALEDRGWLQ